MKLLDMSEFFIFVDKKLEEIPENKELQKFINNIFVFMNKDERRGLLKQIDPKDKTRPNISIEFFNILKYGNLDKEIPKKYIELLNEINQNLLKYE